MNNKNEEVIDVLKDLIEDTERALNRYKKRISDGEKILPANLGLEVDFEIIKVLARDFVSQLTALNYYLKTLENKKGGA